MCLFEMTFFVCCRTPVLGLIFQTYQIHSSILFVIRMHCFVSYGHVALTIGLGPRKCVKFLASVVAVFVFHFFVVMLLNVVC